MSQQHSTLTYMCMKRVTWPIYWPVHQAYIYAYIKRMYVIYFSHVLPKIKQIEQPKNTSYIFMKKIHIISNLTNNIDSSRIVVKRVVLSNSG